MSARMPRGRRSIDAEESGRYLMANTQDFATFAEARLETTASRLRELVAHLRQQRAQLREEWARLMTEAKLLAAMAKEEVFAEATAEDANYVEALGTAPDAAL